jgi:hypothetical protein
MHPNTSDHKFSEQTLKQVASDASRAMIRARYCLERSRIDRFACVDAQPETDLAFGRQLWFFEGMGVDELDRRMRVYGAIEYSLQYGLHELVEDGVFEVADQRDRFRHVYRGLGRQPSWKDPAHRWLMLGMVLSASLFVAYVTFRWATGTPMFDFYGG